MSLAIETTLQTLINANGSLLVSTVLHKQVLANLLSNLGAGEDVSEYFTLIVQQILAPL